MNAQTADRASLEAFWMPFTANRQFKAAPRLLARAEGMHYWTPDGRQVLDGVAGLWCVNAGHGRREISEAVARQIAEMDYAPPFQMGHPLAFELANEIVAIAPQGIDHVFFTNSGSESVDTALKIALAYHRVRGEAARTVKILSPLSATLTKTPFGPSQPLEPFIAEHRAIGQHGRGAVLERELQHFHKLAIEKWLAPREVVFLDAEPDGLFEGSPHLFERQHAELVIMGAATDEAVRTP